jgi:CheY-like chemotaxis protein
MDAEPTLPAAVTGDRQRLSQVLLNLGNNAVKFTDLGEVRVVVRRINDGRGTARLEFSVHDTGIGIGAESLPRLFTPFAQLADGRPHRGGGTGLGLVISQKLVKLMGGEITVSSEPGKGSTFRFTLNLAVAEMAAVGGGVTAQPTRDEPLSFLVAEDNGVNQMIIEAMLRQLGHQVTVVPDGRQALAALARDHFDMVLMDCNMPELDGLEATRQLRAGAAGVRDPDVVVIALTANAMDDDRVACLAAGMNDFLPKPVSIHALRQAIGKARARVSHTEELRAAS